MFRNLASDALGLSDIGKVIPASQFSQTDIDDYVLHEDDENIYFLIKSKTDEYCFTNIAFIHLDGQSATSKKRLLKRYPYQYYPPSQVMIETAGTMDLDAELKFHLGAQAFSIDIDKNQIESIRDIYKSLLAISHRCQSIARQEGLLEKSFAAVTGMFQLKTLPETALLNLPDIINQTVQQVETAYNQRLDHICQYDFSTIFEHYIRH